MPSSTFSPASRGQSVVQFDPDAIDHQVTAETAAVPAGQHNFPGGRPFGGNQFGAKGEADALADMQLVQVLGQMLGRGPTHQPDAPFEHRHRGAQNPGAGRHFETDHPATDDQQTAARGQPLAQSQGIVQRTQRKNAIPQAIEQGIGPGPGAGGQEQLGEGQAFAGGQLQSTSACVEPDGSHAEAAFDALGGVEGAIEQGGLGILRRDQDLLGQGWPLVGEMGLDADQDDPPHRNPPRAG